ncbi:MAG: FAD-dependent oxidoreductase, partial [candidate division WS1 bacterium]|nr:FAD-dependent oxidoreductase [candidate division WS1 bacterium]
WRDPMPTNPTFYQVPFRSLLQEHVPNLMLAGRMLDADKIAFSAVRVMVNTNQTGEAAGVAAWMALDQGIPVQQVDPVSLRQTLADGGSVIL